MAIDDDVYQGLLKGAFMPTKNLIFSMALTLGLSKQELDELIWVCYEKLDFSVPKDVVVNYCVENKIFNKEKIDALLAEYKISGLFLA